MRKLMLILTTSAILALTGCKDSLPACQYEDGNPDAMPCEWTDPDTGRKYYNDGSEYRN